MQARLCLLNLRNITLSANLPEGTPFDPGSAKELMRLGILAICIPIGTQMIAEIACGAKFLFTSGNYSLKSLATYSFPIFLMSGGWIRRISVMHGKTKVIPLSGMMSGLAMKL